MNTRKKIAWLALWLVLVLSGCGGGGVGNSASGSVLSGTAAIGSPIVGGTVTVVCAAGTAQATPTTGGSGDWSYTLTGTQTLPCVLQISGGTINGAPNTATYHSVATTPGTVNITPVTDLIISNLSGSATPQTWFAGLTSTSVALITPTAVATSVSAVKTALSLSALNALNPLTVTFNPASGNAMDDVLTALQGAITNTGTSLAALRTAAANPTFTPPVGFSAAMGTAYSNTASGGTPAAVVPNAPANPIATVASASQINLSWAAVTNAVGYHVYRSTSSGVSIAAGNKLTTTPLSGLSYSDTGLMATTPYFTKLPLSM